MRRRTEVARRQVEELASCGKCFDHHREAAVVGVARVGNKSLGDLALHQKVHVGNREDGWGGECVAGLDFAGGVKAEVRQIQKLFNEMHADVVGEIADEAPLAGEVVAGEELGEIILEGVGVEEEQAGDVLLGEIVQHALVNLKGDQLGAGLAEGLAEGAGARAYLHEGLALGRRDLGEHAADAVGVAEEVLTEPLAGGRLGCGVCVRIYCGRHGVGWLVWVALGVGLR